MDRALIGKLVCLAVFAVTIFAFSACGGGGLSASSSCQDFMEASLGDQAIAASRLATDFDTPEYATPLGSPDIARICASNPDISLEELYERLHKSES